MLGENSDVSERVVGIVVEVEILSSDNPVGSIDCGVVPPLHLNIVGLGDAESITAMRVWDIDLSLHIRILVPRTQAMTPAHAKSIPVLVRTRHQRRPSSRVMSASVPAVSPRSMKTVELVARRATEISGTNPVLLGALVNRIVPV